MGLTKRVDSRVFPASRSPGTRTHSMGAGRPDRRQRFIAAFVGGLAVGATVKSVGEQLIRFTEAEGQLLSLSVFFVFGALVIGQIRDLR